MYRNEEEIAYKIQSLVKGKKSVLDIGCEYGQLLYPFIDYGFDVLHGIDNSSEIANYMLYYFARYKFNYASKMKIDVLGGKRVDFSLEKPIVDSVVKLNWPFLYSEFKNLTFDIGPVNGDILHYKFKRKYDLIILRDVLHFFNHEDRMIIVRKIMKALNPNGIVYIRANTEERMRKYSKLDWTKKIAEKTYKEKYAEERVYYLFDEQDFKEISSLFDRCSDLKVSDNSERLGEEIIGIMN